MSTHAQSALATWSDLRQLDPERAWELLDGEIVEKASPRMGHGSVQFGLSSELGGQVRGRRSDDPPTGWWLATEVEIQLGPHVVVRPDIAGWRRAVHPERPRDWPVTARPDWICEILSPSTRRRDLGQKQAIFHRFELPWVWYADPEARFVQVLEWTPKGYLIAATVEPGDVRAIPPFDGVELVVSRFFGLDDGEE